MYVGLQCKYFMDCSTTELNSLAWTNEFHLQRLCKGHMDPARTALPRQAVQHFPQISALLSTAGNSLTYCSQEVIFSLGSPINDTAHLFL